jgi:GT2 family glycosyltransferase
MMRDMGYTGTEYFDATQLKKGIYKATGKGIDKMFADIGQEDFLKGLKTGDAYAALKVTSPVFFEKDLGHPSYPFAIKTVDGSPVNIDIFDKIGGFREDFFIDNVDLEYSLRLKVNGYKSIITKEPGMLHDPGNPITRKVLGRWISSSKHSSLRRYYMARNHVTLSKIYWSKFPYFILKATYFFMLSILFMSILEANRKEKLKMTFKGLKDGLLKSSLQKQ